MDKKADTYNFPPLDVIAKQHVFCRYTCTLINHASVRYLKVYGHPVNEYTSVIRVKQIKASFRS